MYLFYFQYVRIIVELFLFKNVAMLLSFRYYVISHGRAEIYSNYKRILFMPIKEEMPSEWKKFTKK